jgi:hypothetical protein
VQTLLAKEVVLWNHGYLAMPQVRPLALLVSLTCRHQPMGLPCQSDITCQQGLFCVPCLAADTAVKLGSKGVARCAGPCCVPAPKSEGYSSRAVYTSANRHRSTAQLDVSGWYSRAVCECVPQIVVDLQSRLTALLVRMTAVEALLGQEPLLTGRYTAAPYRYISQVRRTVQHPVQLSGRPRHVLGGKPEPRHPAQMCWLAVMLVPEASPTAAQASL